VEPFGRRSCNGADQRKATDNARGGGVREAIADTVGGTKFVTVSAAGNLEDVAEVSFFSYTPAARTVASDVGAQAPNTSDGNPGATT
jgi:hypothetical protein